MAYAAWRGVITDLAGNVVPQASVEVRSEQTGALVHLYEDREGTVSRSNPFLADMEGQASFFALGGAYKITARSGSFERVWRYVGIGTAQEADFEGVADYVRSIITKADVGLGSVDNTPDAAKPVSTPQATALNGKLDKSGGTVTGNLTMSKGVGTIFMRSPNGANGYSIMSNVSDTVEAALIFTKMSTGLQLVRMDYSGYALNVNGNASVSGSFSKGSGTFAIDHPVDPFNKDLFHGFVEAPRYDLIYRGVAKLEDGGAVVDIDAASNLSPGTFEALTINAVVTSLQNQDGFARVRPGLIEGGKFTIHCEDAASTDEIAWVVIAERNDPFVKHMDDNCDEDGRFIPEREKEA